MAFPSRYPADKAQILAILNSADKEMTAKQIAQKVAMCLTRVWDMLRWMTEEQAIHMPRQHGPTRFYRPGPGDTTPAAPLDPVSRILAALKEHGPMRSSEIAEKTGLSRTYVAQLLKHNMRGHPPGQRKLVYIRRYIKEGNVRIHVYDVGNRPDARRPMPQSNKEKLRKQRIKLRADPIKHELYKAKERRRHFKAKADPVMGNMMNMIFGRAPLTPEQIAACEAVAEKESAPA